MPQSGPHRDPPGSRPGRPWGTAGVEWWQGREWPSGWVCVSGLAAAVGEFGGSMLDPFEYVKYFMVKLK